VNSNEGSSKSTEKLNNNNINGIILPRDLSKENAFTEYLRELKNNNAIF